MNKNYILEALKTIRNCENNNILLPDSMSPAIALKAIEIYQDLYGTDLALFCDIATFAGKECFFETINFAPIPLHNNLGAREELNLPFFQHVRNKYNMELECPVSCHNALSESGIVYEIIKFVEIGGIDFHKNPEHRIFYTNYMVNIPFVNAFREQWSHKNTIETINHELKDIDNFQLYSSCHYSEADMVWSMLSKEFANSVFGEIDIFANNPRKNAVLIKTELPHLLSNEDLSGIIVWELDSSQS